MIVTGGSGYYQEKGKPALSLHKGDVVTIAPDIIHWHGAAHDSDFTHIAINTNIQKGVVVWMAKVSDEEYLHLK